ncbi:MAG: hypothetical protein RL339_514, partial [Pseudomonadota bacterium]
GCPGLLQLVIDGAALLQAVDRAVGGTGQAPQSLPAKLPASALLLAQRIEAIACAALAEALPCAAEGLAVYHSAKRATAFPASAEATAILTLTVRERDGEGWPLTLALPVAALDGWPGSAARSQRGPADPPIRLPRPLPICHCRSVPRWSTCACRWPRRQRSPPAWSCRSRSPVPCRWPPAAA